MSVSLDIRGALQVRAATATGFPGSAQRYYEGLAFTPTIGTPYARMTLFPTQGRAAVIGGALVRHQGLFQVDLFYPAGLGTGAAETVADAVKAVFIAGLSVTQGSETVTIEYAERAAAIQQNADWLMVPITVGYHCYSINN
jgi:hypothetical protein